eukprot:6202501-Pleurochrysis_carterae.AAC.2
MHDGQQCERGEHERKGWSQCANGARGRRSGGPGAYGLQAQAPADELGDCNSLGRGQGLRPAQAWAPTGFDPQGRRNRGDADAEEELEHECPHRDRTSRTRRASGCTASLSHWGGA